MSAARGGANRMVRRAVLAVLASLLVVPGPAAARSPELPSATVGLETTAAGGRVLAQPPVDALRPSGRRYVEGVVLVGYRPGTRAADRVAARGAAQATSHRRLSPLAGDVERLTLAPGTSVAAAVHALRRQGGVRFAEPDYYVTVDHSPNDEIYQQNLMWGMKVGVGGIYGSGANEAWATNEIGSREVVVGILDTGVDIAHKDLVKNIWTNPYETPGNGVDDDDNGYVDDIHGWDFFHDDASLFDSEAADFHGTHVAGTIGAQGANAEGVVGVSWAVTMIPMKFIQGEGTTSDAVEALDYLTDLKTRHGLNIVASNNSWGGTEQSQALEDAINRGGDAEILFVAAAGNDGLDIDDEPAYPAAHECVTRFDTDAPRGYDCLISVAAITEDGDIAGFSNHGSTSVDIGAPGQEIASTYPRNAYVYLDGTSMAAPHVTGAIALLASCRSASTSEFLRASVMDNGAPTASLDGLTVTGDRLSIGPMMADCNLGGPRVLLATQAGGTDTPATFGLWFSEPVSGLELSDFTIGGTSSGWTITELVTPFDPAGPYGLNLSATSPPAGTLTVTLKANSVTGDGGTGPAAPVSMTTIVDRAAPTAAAPAANISDIDGLSGQRIPVLLTWSASDSGSGVRYHNVQYSRDGGAWTDLVTEWRFTSLIAYVAPSGTIRFRVGAVDFANHASAWTPGPTFKPRLVQEGANAIDYGGSWSRATSSNFSGGAVRHTSTGKRSATYTFTGRAVGLITTMTPNRGVVKIRLDGDLVAIVDTSWPVTLFRQVVWSKKFSAVKTHTVKVIVVGGQGRVDIDAFAVLK